MGLYNFSFINMKLFKKTIEPWGEGHRLSGGLTAEGRLTNFLYIQKA